MENIASKTKNLFALAFLGFVAVMFIFVLRQFTSQPATATSQSQGSYPGPESAITDPYPAPLSTSQSAATPESLSWLTYSGDDIGYSFDYRSDFLISVASIPDKPFGTVRIIFPGVGAMNIEVLTNLNQLPLDQFVETSLVDMGSTPSPWPTGGVQNYSAPLVIAGRSALGFESHRDLISRFGAAGYVVFVEYNQYVVKATLDGGGPVPDEGTKPYSASDEAIEITIQVLDSLQFHEQ